MSKQPLPRYRPRTILIIACLAVMAVGAGLVYHEARGHPVDYLVWRWTVTFHSRIRQVDDYRVVVSKAAHRLEVLHQSELVATYPIALSHQGLEPRRTWEGALTPEGEFLIASMQYSSVFGPRQMLLDTTQQSLADYIEQYQEAGQERLAAWEAKHGPLDTIWEVYDFNEVNRQYPIWNDILIHGGGSDRDWTLGCIALDNEDLVQLFDLLHRSEHGGLGIVVEIRP